MVYIERSITPYVQKAEKNFKAVLITGARQAGKSTLLKKLFPSRKYITFDDPFIEEQAIQNAGMFMTLNQPPVTFDEVQRIPDLFRYIKIECDKRDEYGLYCLSGSQPFRLMQNVSESLSGRISIIELAGLSLREIQGDTFDQPFLPSISRSCPRWIMLWSVKKLQGSRKTSGRSFTEAAFQSFIRILSSTGSSFMPVI